MAITLTAASLLASTSAARVRRFSMPGMPMIAGEDIEAGEWVYLDPVDKTYKLASATGADAVHRPEGMAENTAVAGQPIFSLVREDAAFRYGGTEDAGTIFVLSDVPGKMTTVDAIASTWYVVVLGIADGAGNMNLRVIQSEVPVP